MKSLIIEKCGRIPGYFHDGSSMTVVDAWTGSGVEAVSGSREPGMCSLPTETCRTGGDAPLYSAVTPLAHAWPSDVPVSRRSWAWSCGPTLRLNTSEQRPSREKEKEKEKGYIAE